jgi:primosomal protein N' (replication factor Y)
MPLIDLLAKNLEDHKQSILLMNSRGYNTFVACDSCGEVISCPSCSISLTYHRANDRLMCHYCGYSRPFTNVCEHCGKPKLRYAGTGTQRIEEELASLFPTARILRMDTDAASTRGVFEKNLLAFGAGDYDIMLGTQMVAKGLNFENVTLVGVINADLALHNDDYRSEERTFDLLTQVVGRSGRGSEKGVALVQTMTPENGVIRLAQKQDYPAFFKNEIVIRKAMIYPPFCDLCVLCAVSENERLALDAANLAVTRLRELGESEYSDVHMIVMPVMPPRIGKIGDRYRFRIIIKCKNSRRLRALIAQLLCEFGKVPQLRDVTLTADINPENLM